MEGLFEAAAANRAEREPWLALAAELKRRGDVRGELADFQLTLEDARGAERHALMLAEEKLLRDRAAELWGPLAGIAPGLTAVWRRGFLDSLVVPGVSLISQRSGELLREELLPRELLSRVVDHDVARLCRYLYAGRKPKRAPPWIERLDLAQAVVTSDLMRLPKLRALRVAVLVASAALRHPTLEHVTLPATGPFLDVLEDAALPALKSLALTGLDAAGPEPARVVRALTALGPERVYLSLGGRRASAPWTADAVRAIEPVTDRIAGLGLVSPIPTIDLELPRLRRLSLIINLGPGAGRDDSPIPELPTADEVHVHTTGSSSFRDPIRGGRGGGAATNRGQELGGSRALQSARILHLEAADGALNAIADSPLPRLEELSIAATDLRRIEWSDAFFAKDSFPNVRTVSVVFAEQIPGLARSPLAARVETLSVNLTPRLQPVGRWLELRASFPRLKTLVVNGWHRFDAETRVMIERSVPEVIWGRTNSEARRAMFDGERPEPGFVSNSP